MDSTQQIKDAHPWLSDDEALNILLYNQGSMWVQKLERNEFERSMEAFTKLVKSKSRKALEPFVKFVLDVYYNCLDKYDSQIEKSRREVSFEHR